MAFTPIGGATAQSYTVQSGDAGHRIRCKVTIHKSGSTNVAQTPLVDAPIAAPGVSSAVSAGIASLPSGAVAPNSITGFTHPAGTVTASVFGGSTDKYYHSSNFTEPLLLTVGSSRDHEIDVWGQTFNVFLRYVGGKAVCFQLGTQAYQNYMQVTFRGAITFGGSNVFGGPTGFGDIFYPVQQIPYPGGFSIFPDSSGWKFTIGCQGAKYYIKLNGVEFWSYNFWQHVEVGQIMIQTQNDTDGVRVSDVRYLNNTGLSDYSSPAYILDARDWGLKSTKTTGSINANTKTLTLADVSGFNVGDNLVVEIGKEPGAGAMYTVGVGGTWPSLRYATQADLPPANIIRPGNYDVFAWVEDTQKVWICRDPQGGGWANFTDADAAGANSVNLWYWKRLMPRSLRAKILDIDIPTKTLTLSKGAEVSVVDADVYHDNSKILPYMFGTTDNNTYTPNRFRPNITFQIPAGTYVFCEHVQMGRGDYYTYTGAGRALTTIYSPKGCAQASWDQSGIDIQYKDLKFHGWGGYQYWCHDSDYYFDPLYTCVTAGGTYVNGGHAHDIDFLNVWGGVIFETRYNAIIEDCSAISTNGGIQQYFVWFFQIANSGGSWMRRLSYQGDKLMSAFEIFNCTGGGMEDITSVNGVFSSNSSGANFEINNPHIELDYDAQPTTGWIGLPQAININANIHGGAGNPSIIASGGTINNPTILIPHARADGGNNIAIVIQADTPNIRVNGTYIYDPVAPKGLIVLSGPTIDGEYKGALGVISDGAATKVHGIRVIGTVFTNWANILLRSNDGACEVVNCVADIQTIFQSNVVGQFGNIINADYAGP